MAEQKTNAMRMLDKAKIPYQIHTYEHSDGKIDGVSVAAKLGQDVDTVYKTLVTRGASRIMFLSSRWQRSWILRRPQNRLGKNRWR